MRNALLTLLAICSLSTTRAQLTGGVGGGVNTQGHFLATLDIGFRIRDKWYGGFDERVIAKADQPAYFGVKAGKFIGIGYGPELMPFVGAYYKIQSTDKKYLNGWKPGGGVMLTYLNYYVSVAYVEHPQFTIGFFGTARPGYKKSCNQYRP